MADADRQPSPYSEPAETRVTCPACKVAQLLPGESEIRFTVEQMRGLVDEIASVLGATSISTPAQTPMLNRLSNTLIVEIAERTGRVLQYPGIPEVKA